MKEKFIAASIIIVLHFLLSIFAGALGWELQMVIVSSASILAVFFTYKLVSKNFLVCLLVIAPFYLLYSIGSIYVGSYWTYPIWIFGFILSVITYLLLRYKWAPLVSIPLLSLLVAIGGLIIWPNNFAFLNTKKNPDQYSLLNSRLVDSSEREVGSDELKGKVVLFDIWHSACLSCIQKFPELQQLYNHYKDDPAVRIISLNLPLAKDKGIRPARFTERFSFGKMYFLNEQEYQKFSDIRVPIVLIMDKQQRCRYAGDLNAEWNVFIGNAKHIINKLKKE